MFQLSSNTPEPANQALLVYLKMTGVEHPTAGVKIMQVENWRVCGSFTLI